MAKPITEESVAADLNQLMEDTRADIEDVRAQITEALAETDGKDIGTTVTRAALRLAELEGRLDCYKTVDYRLNDHAMQDTPYDDRRARAYHLLVNRLAQTPTEDRVNHAGQAHQEGFRLAFRDVAGWLTAD